ncbi:(2Fe-2S)-binding protein, partial [Klebsiella pneumoniae]|nr:(2Fe-2S)-binding protein [Klebsiella pneumoniae]
TPFGFVADNWSSVGNYPPSSDFRAPEGIQCLRHFEMHLPFTATLTIHFPADAKLVIMNAASPLSTRVTRRVAPIARN